MNKQNNCITIRYNITASGIATYNEEDSAKIRAYMEEDNCSVEEAIWGLAADGVIEGYPEEIGTDQENRYIYTEEDDDDE